MLPLTPSWPPMSQLLHVVSALKKNQDRNQEGMHEDSIRHETPEHAARNPRAPAQGVPLTVFSEMSVSAATPGPTSSSSVAVSSGVAVPYSSYAP